jgi:hypothetical protein
MRRSPIVVPAIAFALTLAACGSRDAPAPAAAAVTPEEPATSAEPSATAAVAAPTPGRATSAHFALLDQDGNGSVAADEHARAATAMFLTMDSDADGVVTSVEMDAAQDLLEGDRRVPSSEKIRAVDRDQDDSLSRQEHALAAQSVFGMMDIDADGRLTPAEVEAGHAQAMGGDAAAPMAEAPPAG